MYKRCLWCLWTALFTVSVSGQAHEPSRNSVIEGRIEGLGVLDARTLQVEAVNAQGRAVANATVAFDGGFELRRLADGDYRVRVVAMPYGTVLKEAATRVGVGGVPLTIQLDRSAAQRPATSLVSKKLLENRPPKAASKLFRQGVRHAAKGETEKAAESYRAAIALHPAFAEAHGNLGAWHARVGDWPAALKEFELARGAGLESSAIYSNLACAHLALGRNEMAERLAREALRREPDSPRAHYVLGLALAARGAPAGTVLDHLEQAAPSVPSARSFADRFRASDFAGGR